MRILISACLMGSPVRYDGKEKHYAEVEDLLRDPGVEAVPFCPECAGGLPVPRTPSERRGEQVVDQEGRDVTEAFREGARRTVQMAIETGCKAALLKARSPSCGSGTIYDGTFSGTIVSGDGVAVEALREAGIPVYSETDIQRLKEEILCNR